MREGGRGGHTGLQHQSKTSNHQEKECELSQTSVEGSVRLIRQLISTKVNKNSDVGLIEKCTREDAQRVVRYTKSCSHNLFKYTRHPNVGKKHPEATLGVQGTRLGEKEEYNKLPLQGRIR